MRGMFIGNGRSTLARCITLISCLRAVLSVDRLRLQSADGREASAVNVFGGALKFIRQVALIALKEAGVAVSSAEDIRWVLTVPAIWSPTAKQMMRTGQSTEMDDSNVAIRAHLPLL
jgi:hypothetical protein